jgi:hypothetical protein
VSPWWRPALEEGGIIHRRMRRAGTDLQRAAYVFTW